MREVRAERVGNRIHLTTPYLKDPWKLQEQLDATKNIPGANFSPSKRVWTYPLDIGVCRRMRVEFGDRLQLGPELIKWGRAEVKREKALRATLDSSPLQPAELFNVPALAPTLHAAMLDRGYQTIAARFGGQAGAHCNFDEQGLGKCVESFGALIEAGVFGKGLIIAPRTALSVTWVSEIKRWLDDVEGDVLVHLANVQPLAQMPHRVRAATMAERQGAIENFLAEADNYTYAFLLVNPEMLQTTREYKCSWATDRYPNKKCGGEHCGNKRNHNVAYNHKYPLLHTTEWDFVIGDETQRYLLNSVGKKASQSGLGAQHLQVKPLGERDGMRIALTGTPMKGKPLKLYETLAWVRPSVYTSRWRFAGMYFKSKPNVHTISGIEYLDEIRPDRMAALDRELSRVIIRRTSKELRALNPDWAPPDISYFEAWTDLTPKQAALYEQMEQNASVQMTGRVVTANNVLEQLTRLKQFASAEYDADEDGEFRVVGPGGKFEWAMDDFLPSLGIYGPESKNDGDAKTLIVSQFTKQINYWEKCLQDMGIETFRITGEEDDDKRVKYQRRFQCPGGPRVFLLNTFAGGVSLTLDAADYGLMMDETWNPDDQDQAEKRNHRTSRVDHYVKWYYVRARHTIESYIAGKTERKDFNQKRVLDKRRGIEWAKKAWGVEVSSKPKRRRVA